jgi:hypothetical protein
MAVKHVHESRESLEADLKDSPKLKGFVVNGAFVAAVNVAGALYLAHRADKLPFRVVEVTPLPTEEQVLEGLGRLSDEGKKAALKALGKK